MRNEVYITRTVTKTVYADRDELLNMEQGSNQLAFISGIVITLLLVGVVALIVVFCLRRRMAKQADRIFLQDRQRNPMPINRLGGLEIS